MIIPWESHPDKDGYIVGRARPGLPHYFVSASTSEYRYRMAQTLCAWLNGGDEPEWLPDLERVSAEAVKTGRGHCITAKGPYFADQVKGVLFTRLGDDRIDRGLLINALMKRERPLNSGPWPELTPAGSKC